MAEWVDEGDSTYTLTVGSLRATVQSYTSESFEWRIRHTDTHETLERWTAPLPLDEAKADAEQALRKMYDALSKHFAPVLRWYRCGDQCDAEVDDWMLLACSGSWVIKHEFGARVTSDPSCSLTSEQSCRAAEAALRSLGVVFRTEGE